MENRRISRRIARFDDRLIRLAKCGRVRMFARVGVQLSGRGEATLTGLTTCASIHCCAVCSAKIREQRSAEFSAICDQWQADGNTVLLLGLTFPHALPDRLTDTYATVADGWRWITAHRKYKVLRASLPSLHWVRTVEITHGPNGFHPHIHACLMIGGDQSAVAAARVATVLRPLWDAYLIKRGIGPAHPLHGVDVQICQSGAGAAAYVCKSQDGWGVGRELFRGDAKAGRGTGSRTYFQIIDAYGRTGSPADLALAQEYMLATFGRRAFSFSAGFREAFPACELAAEVPDGQTIALIEADTWDRLADIPGLPALILQAAVNAGRSGIDRLMISRGFPPTTDPYPQEPGAP
jgi:hypothetical protein